MVPANLKKYFWETDAENLDIKEHKKYILERILELGDDKAAEWIKKTFLKKEILNVLEKSRKISKKSANFWKIILQK